MLAKKTHFREQKNACESGAAVTKKNDNRSQQIKLPPDLKPSRGPDVGGICTGSGFGAGGALVGGVGSAGAALIAGTGGNPAV